MPKTYSTVAFDKNIHRLGSAEIHTIDLNFSGLRGTTAAYLILHNAAGGAHTRGAALVECGPGSTIPALQAGLQAHGLNAEDISDVFVTHIHLDHAGAAGWFARKGARIHVHPAGAPHMLNPEKLLSSAKRIYGDQMDTMWGEFLPVPAERLSVLQDGDVVEIGTLRLRALDTPGHAKHHFAYLLDERGQKTSGGQGAPVCFSGDIAGVRLQGYRHLRLPMPPPDLHFETWRESLKRLQDAYVEGAFTRIAPTHFGIFEDVDWHLAALNDALDEVEQWMMDILHDRDADDLSIEQLSAEFLAWTRQRSLKYGLDPAGLEAHEAANPSGMSPHGILRYWRKFRGPRTSGGPSASDHRSGDLQSANSEEAKRQT